MVSVAVFTTDNAAGRELFTGCRSLVRSLYGRSARVRDHSSSGPASFATSSVAADLVIFDGTPDGPGEHRYGIIQSASFMLEHVLLVGRRYLPVNVVGTRRGGAPVYPHEQSNEAILEWIEHQLTGPDRIELPRPLWRKAVPPLLSSQNRVGARRAAGRQVFLSYRGTTYDIAKDLKRRIEQGVVDGGRRSVQLYEPGELAVEDEVLSPLMRWNVLSIISDAILDCEEFWVVDHPEYWRSWWTRGELATRAYFNDRAVLRVYDPVRGTVQEAGPEYQVTLAEAQRRRMARCFVNSHPEMMAPEAMVAMRGYAALGLQRIFRMASDEVFSDSFWSTPLLQCAACNRGRDAAPNDLDAFLTNRYPVLHPVPAADLVHAAGQGTPLPCPNEDCPGALRYRVELTPPRYVWYPLPVGPTATSLETLPTYRVVPV
ncbi:hypothetical protein [Streptomyces poonensis]|uniref:Uncharacterized protein n=1 Tax=Streptomyces poonensis TaxID=68255 RepID=A0A918UZ71_9ACTN|nr:hypothetical protein [Streptomyces poonensis]GGZ44173.1 hypothetical protein GCM10010365_75820 [Streptomyces poonensis]GLJ88195.1 hypothetical protein GCM10017589_07950 [Streptomyces poonensis]